MFNKIFVVSCVLALCLMLSLGCGSSYSQQSGDGNKAPDFSLKGLDGKDVKLSDIVGTKPIILDFFATWCPHCVSAAPQLDSLYQNQKDKIAVYGIDIQESSAKVESFVKKLGLKYPILMDADGKVAGDYEVRGIPTVVVVGLDGKVAYYGHSVAEAKAVAEKLAK